MHRLAVVTVLALSVLAPGAAYAQSPEPSPSPDAGPDYCGNPETGERYERGPAEVHHTTQTITAGESFTYALSIPGPWNRVFADIGGYSWISPTQRGAIGAAVASSGNGTGPFAPGEVAARSITLTPATNTKLSWRGALYCGPGPFHGDVEGANPVVVDVAPRLSLTAVRNGVRDYTFSGVATTPGLVLNLYRVNADGSRVLTAQTRATDARTWTIRRTFLGSGRFGFVVRTGRTMANAPGTSNVRPTVIH